MQLNKIKKIADTLINYSTKIKKGDYVQIISDVNAEPLILEIYKQTIKKGAYPKIHLSLPKQSKIYYENASEEQLKKFPEISMYELKNTKKVIYISSPSDTRELEKINPKKISIRQKTLEPYTKYRVEKTNWVIFDYPSKALAKEANMPLNTYEKFVFNSVNLDWEKFSKSLLRIKKALDKTKEVKIISKDTNITLNIENRKAVIGNGSCNMPDGEIFTAPVETKTQGYITFTYPAIYSGRLVSGIYLEFKNGKIVRAKAKENEKFLQTMVNTDKGSHYLGELGIGCNYKINKFTKNILFDEKIGGSIHLAIGSAYSECKGKNKSAVHWDIIKDLKKDKGKMYFDNKLVQKEGKFLI